jgi:hypothetical protein
MPTSKLLAFLGNPKPQVEQSSISNLDRIRLRLQLVAQRQKRRIPERSEIHDVLGYDS